MFFSNPFKSRLPLSEEALPDRLTPIVNPRPHAVHGRPIAPPFPAEYIQLYLGMGCFWGAERLFWTIDGAYSTAVGYAGGMTKNPTYEEVCSGKTGHAEVVMVVFDPKIVSPSDILSVFWQSHNPTQANRQGNDIGTQYRSAIYTCDDETLELARKSARLYGTSLSESGFGAVTTQISTLDKFYYAEDYHQQYLHKVPNGYCGLKGVGISCNIDK